LIDASIKQKIIEITNKQNFGPEASEAKNKLIKIEILFNFN